MTKITEKTRAAATVAMLETAKAASVAVEGQLSALNAMSVAILKAVKQHGTDKAAALIEQAKGPDGFDYASRSDQGKASWRTAAKYLNKIVGDEAAMDAVINGEKLPSQAHKELTKPETEARAKERAEKAEREEREEQERIAGLEAAAGRVISPAEMAVMVAAWLDQNNMASLSTAENKAASMLLDAIDGFVTRSVKPAAKPAKRLAA